jgi:hypothetical protein
MTLVNLPGVMATMPLGGANRQNFPVLSSFSGLLVNGAEHSITFYGRIFWTDGGTHTVDTTGSSSFQLRTSTAITFASATTVVKFGLAAIDPNVGPPARAVMSGNLVVFDVYSQITQAAMNGISASTWCTTIPTTGSKTIASGDMLALAFQMTVRGGTDQLGIQGMGTVSQSYLPSVTSWTVGSGWQPSGLMPNFIITASDGTLGYLQGSFIADTPNLQTLLNTGSNPIEVGNIWRVPFPCRMYGILVHGWNAVSASDANYVLYSSPFSTPVAERTIVVDGNVTLNLVNFSNAYLLFPTPFDVAPNTDYVLSLKPVNASPNVQLMGKQVIHNDHLMADHLGKACHGVSRADFSSPFATINSGKNLYAIMAMVGGFDDGTGSGGGGGTTAKYWNGSAWVDKPMMAWDGNAWV